MRLGLDERGVTELMAAVDHASGLAKLAAGLRLASESSAASASAGLLAPVPEPEPGSRLGTLFDEIQE